MGPSAPGGLRSLPSLALNEEDEDAAERRRGSVTVEDMEAEQALAAKEQAKAAACRRRRSSIGAPDMSALLPMARPTSRTITAAMADGDMMLPLLRQGSVEEKPTALLDIESKLMQSNVILEAFGNAKTVRNDNSSRFGKYIKLQYNEVGRMVQARTMHFLLEKSRLVTVAGKERNYHVFYQLCAGLEGTEMAMELDLEPASKYRLCNMGKCLTVDGVNDAKDFAELQTSLKESGASDAELEAIAKLVAALLQLGELHGAPIGGEGGGESGESGSAASAGPCKAYKLDTKAAVTGACKCGHPKAAHAAAASVAGDASGNSGERCQVVGAGLTPEARKAAAARAAALLGVEEDAFQLACTVHEIETASAASSLFGGGGKAKKTQIMLSEQGATENVMALIKFVYAGLFNWLVDKINDTHRASTDGSTAEGLPSFIGILDIFGFEIMETNSFEQLCINFANEVLQQQFNQTIFVQEQAMYVEEGLDWTQISFRDNQGIIDLIGKKPRGLLVVCEEHVKLSFVKAFKNNTALIQQLDKTHTGKDAEGHDDSSFYSKGRFNAATEFIIKHFAGDVTYTITGFIEKNLDSLNGELKGLLTSSTEPFLVTLFGDDAAAKTPDMPGYLPPPPEPTPTEAEAAAAEAAAASPGAGNRMSMARRGGDDSKKSAGASSVSLKFRQQLDELTATLRATTPHYIKCIKPNGVKAAGAVSHQLIVQQLRYSGVLEVVRIRREAYPTRLSFAALHKAFNKLLVAAFGGKDRGTLSFNPRDTAAGECSEAQSKEACAHLLGRFLEPTRFQLGKTRVFLRNQVLELLKGCEDAFFGAKAATIQAASRMAQARRRYRGALAACAVLQRNSRTLGPRLGLKRAKRAAARLQAMARGRRERDRWRRYRAARRVQALLRGRRSAKRHAMAKAAALLLGSRMRGKLARMHFGKEAVLRKAAIKLQAAARGRVYKARGAAKLLAARHCANLIAARMRRRFAEKQLQRAKRAAVAMQCSQRSKVSRQLVGAKRQAKLEYDSAVIWQKQWRAIIARKRFSSIKTLDRLRREKEAKKATKLQSMWLRRKATANLSAHRRAVVRIAAVVRRLRAEKQLAEAKAATVKLQASARCLVGRKKYVAYKAAERLQARARASARRRAFVKTRADVVRCQTVARRRNALVSRVARKAAVLRIARAVNAWQASLLLDVCLDRAHRRCLAGDRVGLQRVLDVDAAPLAAEGVDLRAVRHRRHSFRHLVHAACLGGSLTLVAELGPTKAELTSPDADGNSALHHAAATCNLDLVKLLLGILAPDCTVSAEDVNAGTISKASASGGSKVKAVAARRGSVLLGQARPASVARVDTSTMLAAAEAAASPTAQAAAAKASKGKGGSLVGGSAKPTVDESCVVRKGFLKKRRETDTFRKRYCVLRSDATGLSYYDTATSTSATRIPLGGALLKRCTLATPGHKFAFEIHSPQLMRGKNKEGRLYFGCESEVELNEWFTDLRKVCGSTQTDRASRTQPLHLVNVRRRGACLMRRNAAGETPLHLAAHLGRRAGIDPKAVPGAGALQLLAWLVENGADVNAADAAGRTALHVLVEAGASGMPAVLMLTHHKGGNMSLPTHASAGGQTALDLCDSAQLEQVMMRGSVKMGDHHRLLAPPAPKVANCCYASLLLESSKMASTERFKQPFVTTTLFKLGGVGGEDHKSEEPQTVAEPCVTRPDYFWWGATVHVQTPLENLGGLDASKDGKGGVALLVELRDGSQSHMGPGFNEADRLGGWALLDVSKSSIDTKDVQLELFAFPVDLKRRALRGADVFVSARIVLTRMDEDEDGDSEDEAEDLRASHLVDSLSAARAKAAPPAPPAEAPRSKRVSIPGTPSLGEKLTALTARLTAGELTQETFDAAKKDVLAGRA